MRPSPAIALAALVLLGLAGLHGCSERDLSELSLAPINDDPVVFADTFGDGVDYQAFQGSLFTAVTIDASVAFAGTASLKVTVPGPDDEGGTYAGGAFTSSDYRDLSGYDALVFYARSSVTSTLNVAGLGNDNTGNSLYAAQRQAIPLTTDWSLIVIPIPDPSRLDLERGLFFFAEGHENNLGFTLWFDEIRFARLGTITDPRPAMASRAIETFVGAVVTAEETERHLRGQRRGHRRSRTRLRYFDYFSSDETRRRDRRRRDQRRRRRQRHGHGEARHRCRSPAASPWTSSRRPPSRRPRPPSRPRRSSSLFSDAYTNVPVDTWRATWSLCGPVVGPSSSPATRAKVYTGLTYAGIEFVSQLIDATDMTHVRMDVWAPAGSIFRIKLVDFGEDGVYNLPIDQSELAFQRAVRPGVRGRPVVGPRHPAGELHAAEPRAPGADRHLLAQCAPSSSWTTCSSTARLVGIDRQATEARRCVNDSGLRWKGVRREDPERPRPLADAILR